MGVYVPNTEEEQKEMLKAAGFTAFEDMYRDVPREMLLTGELSLPSGLSEMQVGKRMEQIGRKNQVFDHIFRGAGSYYHYIPAIVKSVVNKEEFVTAYTPYQAEISQGILQSIFEYQTVICELTGMDAANASVYDGATAAAEAAAMCRERKRTVAYVSAAARPETISVIKTYCFGNGSEVCILPEKDGRTDMEALKEKMGEEASCLYVEQPNYYGNLEDCAAMAEIAHEKGAKVIIGCNPLSLALLKAPAEYGADVAVGEAQPLGLPMAFGGPYIGFMAVKKELMRKLPGRMVGQTVDADGKRGFVLTLQAREQHIRREKAGSNICSNEALCALTVSAYAAAMGQKGMEQAALSSMSNAHYLKDRLGEIGYERVHTGPFFHEFVTTSPVPVKEALDALKERGYLGGLPIGENRILWCATEMNDKEEMDELISILKEVGA